MSIKKLIIIFALSLNLNLNLSAIKYRTSSEAMDAISAIVKTSQGKKGSVLKSEYEIQLEQLKRLKANLKEDDQERAKSGKPAINTRALQILAKKSGSIYRALYGYQAKPPRENPFLKWKLAKVSKDINSLGSNNVPIKYKH